ncbi:MAG: hypothetical protein NT062_30495 [Proteobacteria bacterium]|nr:hypothetical protein [Pseudomonadota bacterium]
MLHLDRYIATIQGTWHDLAKILGATSIMVAPVTPDLPCMESEQWHATLAPASLHLLDEALHRLALDPAQVDARDHNRALDLGAWLERSPSPHVRAVVPQLQLEGAHVAGLLVYEGDQLLGWFGVVLPAPPSARQLAVLDQIRPTIQRRLASRWTLQRARQPRTLELDLIRAAAFVLGPAAAILDTNAVARTLLAARPEEVVRALADVVALRPNELAFALYPIGHTGGCLAILQGSTFEA